MMTKLVPLLAALLLAGCGAGEPAGRPDGSSPAASVSRPDEPPPSLGDDEAPPPAWIETDRGSFWLAYSSYCWASTCADYVGVADRDDVPAVVVREGEVIRFHLGFRPLELRLGFEDGTEVSPRPTRSTSWTADRGGAISLFARATPEEPGSDASYVAILELR